MGKFYLFSAAIQEGFVGLAIIGVLNSVLSVFYYFRLMVMMYMKDPPADQPEPEPMALPVAAIVVLGAIGIFWLGIAPAYMFTLASYSSFALK